MTDWDERVCAAWLAGPLLPPETLLFLIRRYASAREIYRAFVSGDRECRERINPAHTSALIRGSAPEAMERCRDLMESHGIRAMLYNDPDYPECLRRIPEPPGVLFYQGNPGCASLQRKIAIVGSRRASYRGREATEKVALELSRSGVCIVSGLAYGIDTAAHKGCLDGGSPTIAVLGCGLDRTYPVENTSLRQAILEAGGLVLSEFAPGESPLGWHFPIRNRIISGLGNALVVMEARQRSGSLSTVQWALDQGRDVFAYPGDPALAEYNEGNHQLLRDGARFFARSGHILEDMNWLDNPAETGQNTTSLPEEHFSPQERRILEALSPGAMGMDELCARTGIQPAELMSAITMLQMRRRVEALPGKLYRCVSLDR